MLRTHTHPHTRSFGKIQRPLSHHQRDTRSFGQNSKTILSHHQSSLYTWLLLVWVLGFPLAGPFCQVDISWLCLPRQGNCVWDPL
jgi:hypothetical protein